MLCNARIRGRLIRRRRILQQSVAIVGFAAAIGALPANADAADGDDQAFVCTNPDCDPYVYDPAAGDAANIADPGRPIPPGTPFAALPETWRCPLCGAPKSAFIGYDRASDNIFGKGGR